MGLFFGVCFGIILGGLLIAFACLPSFIAEKRGVRKIDVKIITILGLLGLLFFPFWIVAFILSLVYRQE